jgi:protein TonB
MEPAENFIPVADFIPVNLDLAGPAENPAAGSAGEDSAGPSSGAANTALGMAAATDYVKHNYEYIQRRIRDKLAYPAQARRAGLQGSAEISFTIHEDGSVSDVTITSSSGSELLDTVAMEAIRAASPFRPPPAEARLAIPVTFRLR